MKSNSAKREPGHTSGQFHSNMAICARTEGLADSLKQCVKLLRRGFDLGEVTEVTVARSPSIEEITEAWRSAHGCRVAQFAREDLANYQTQIQQSVRLMQRVLDDDDVESILSEPEYAQRLEPEFIVIGSVFDEGDPQEIAKVEFDVVKNDELVAENVWVKLSWLSFVDDDTSLRFRFSFGMEQYEDVSADYTREILAAELAERIFPECAVITKNQQLIRLLSELVGKPEIEFVERIVYFNAPNGGAQFHQDVERGHLGVVFAQLHGRTAWFSLSKQQLVAEVKTFLTRDDAKKLISKVSKKKAHLTKLLAIANDSAALGEMLDSMENDALEAVLNRLPQFAQQLIDKGFGYIVNPGDVMLLPQDSQDHCAWHTVFCLDDYPGHALSFAIREKLPSHET